MLTLNLSQLELNLPLWIEGRLSIAIVGPPGTGKTHTSRLIASATGRPVELLDGGQENEWKALFPFRLPGGDIQPGKALLANKGTLIIDEFNRVPVEMKSPFQLLASEKVVPWPERGVKPVDLAIIGTANDVDLGVEEAAKAELDRYDLIVRVMPTPEEIGAIVSKQTGLSLEAAQIIYEAVAELGQGLDPRRFNRPEGIRMAISVARVLDLRGSGVSPQDVFVGAAGRCFPLGRPGAEKYQLEFDALVVSVAKKFAAKLATVTSSNTSSSSAQPEPVEQVKTLDELQFVLVGSLRQTITSSVFPLPLPFTQEMHAFTHAFGLGVTMHLVRHARPGNVAERRGVKLHFGINGASDGVEFIRVERARVEQFVQALLAQKGAGNGSSNA